MFSDSGPYFVSAGFLRAHLLDHAFGPYFVSAGFRIPALGRQTTKNDFVFLYYGGQMPPPGGSTFGSAPGAVFMKNGF